MIEAIKEKTITEIHDEIMSVIKELVNTNKFGYIKINIGNGTAVIIEELKSKKYIIKK